ncbi:hypothetical protein [Streptomyces sp. NBC_00344]|uniref:hypothetical protein n=1 Tax=Streptomyces sp. NBC_00344 TaxID=2975720 RepID=UPI002E1D0F68
MTDSQPKVDNPYRARLVSLKRELLLEVDDLKKLLKKPAGDVGGKHAPSWVGRNARKWHTDIEGHRTHLQKLVSDLVPAVQAEIDRSPEKVSPAEAKMMRMDLQQY